MKLECRSLTIDPLPVNPKPGFQMNGEIFLSELQAGPDQDKMVRLEALATLFREHFLRPLIQSKGGQMFKITPGIQTTSTTKVGMNSVQIAPQENGKILRARLSVYTILTTADAVLRPVMALSNAREEIAREMARKVLEKMDAKIITAPPSASSAE